MTTADEKVQETVETAAEKLAEAAAEATGAAGEALGREPGDEITGLEGNEWSFLMRALVAVTVVIVCLILTRVIRGENPQDKRVRLRNERRAKKKANQEGPDEIDKLLSSIVRRQPGQAPPPGSVPISGRGVPRGVPPGGAGRGAGPAGGTSAARVSGPAAAAAAAAAGRRGVAGRGPPPPPGADNRPKLRWDQNNEEVEIVVRVDPKVARSDVKVEVTSTMLKLSLRGQPVIAGHLFKTVDPEGCTWQIEDPGPGYPKEVMITLLKTEPTTRRENWWRAPLKGLENRGQPRPAPQPADPEMVRKAIEAIKAKTVAGAKPGVKLGAKPGGAGQTLQAPGTASSAATSQGASVAATGAAGATAAPATAGVASPAPPAGQASAGDDVTKIATAKANKGGGKKKNRKKK